MGKGNILLFLSFFLLSSHNEKIFACNICSYENKYSQCQKKLFILPFFPYPTLEYILILLFSEQYKQHKEMASHQFFSRFNNENILPHIAILIAICRKIKNFCVPILYFFLSLHVCICIHTCVVYAPPLICAVVDCRGESFWTQRRANAAYAWSVRAPKQLVQAIYAYVARCRAAKP